jgi:hypothetical protein
MIINREFSLTVSIVIFLWAMIAMVLVVGVMVWRHQTRIIKLESTMVCIQDDIKTINRVLEPIGPGPDNRRGKRK